MCCYCNEQRFHHRPSSESPASLHGSLSHYRGHSHFHHKTSHECFSQPLCFLIEAVQMSVVLALSLTFMYFHQSLRNTACAGFSLRWWVGMFYTHSDKPRILAAPLNCLRDIHVWAASIRQWGSIAFNSKYIIIIHLSFIQQKLFTCSVMADFLWPHGLQHAKLPCPSPTSGAYSNSVPLSQWCHSTISSSVIPFSSCFQSFSAWVLSNESALHIRWPKYWNFSFSFSISPSNDYSQLISFRMNCFDLLAVQGTWESSLTPQDFSNTTVKNHQFFLTCSLLSGPTLTSIHDCWKNP